MSKDFFKSTLLYLNNTTDPNVAVYPLKSLLYMLIASKLPVFFFASSFSSV